MRWQHALQPRPRHPRRALKEWVAVLAATLLAAVIGMRCLVLVGDSGMVVVTQFGRIVRGPITEAGLHTKRPWQSVARVEGRVRLVEFEPRAMLTGNHEPIVVQPYLCWRVVPEHVERFLAATADGTDVEDMLRDVVSGALDDAVASHALSDWVAAAARTIDAQGPTDWPLLEPALKRCNLAAERVGVRIVDVGLQRIGRPERLATPVAQSLEAEGRLLVSRVELEALAEAARIETDARLEADAIVGTHLNEARRLRHEGRNEAAGIYADSYARHEELARVLEQLAILRRLIEQEAATPTGDD